MRNILFGIAIALVATGCGTSTKIQSAYWGEKPTHVAVPAPASFVPAKLNVYLHPIDQTKAAVWPPFGTSMKAAVSDGTDPWIATLERQRAAYEAALMDALRSQNRQCSVIDATPYPDLFMFEFVLNCTPTADN